MGTLLHIFISPAAGESMHSVSEAELITDCGIKGDRYANSTKRKRPADQITLIESEQILAFIQETGLPLAPYEPRRNLLTQGVNLNTLRGKRFRIGEAELEGLELCEPCTRFAKNTYPEVLRFFVHKGGLNAKIVVGGHIFIDDEIEECA